MALRYLLALAFLCSNFPLAAQSARVQDLGLGKLLVASRDARDPVFAQTVILLVRYDRTGTLGLTLNRRSNIPVSRALAELKGAKGRVDPAYLGGPVETTGVLALLRSQTMPEGASHVFGKIYFVPRKLLLEKALAEELGPDAFRVYLGYCGWAPGQLENEMQHGFWHVLPGEAGLVFDAEPDTLWARLIGGLELRLAGIAGAVWPALQDHP